MLVNKSTLDPLRSSWHSTSQYGVSNPYHTVLLSESGVTLQIRKFHPRKQDYQYVDLKAVFKQTVVSVTIAKEAESLVTLDLDTRLCSLAQIRWWCAFYHADCWRPHHSALEELRQRTGKTLPQPRSWLLFPSSRFPH